MLRKSVYVIGLAAVSTILMAALLSGCGDKGPQTATLALSSNPTTGYAWRVEQEPEIFDITSDYMEEQTDGEIAGAGGTETFTLTPKEPGSATVDFYYEQSWDKDNDPTHLTYQITVDENMQIVVESQSGDMPGDESEAPELPQMDIQ